MYNMHNQVESRILSNCFRNAYCVRKITSKKDNTVFCFVDFLPATVVHLLNWHVRGVCYLIELF